jgi:hypothetical protein
MNGRVVLAIVLVLVLVGVGAGIGISAYNAGVAQGMVESGKVAAPAQGFVPYPYYGGPFFHPFGFGLFGLLIPLFFLFVFFGVLRAIFWRGRWGGHGMHDRWANGAPPMFEEWHRRMHEQHEEPRSS